MLISLAIIGIYLLWFWKHACAIGATMIIPSLHMECSWDWPFQYHFISKGKMKKKGWIGFLYCDTCGFRICCHQSPFHGHILTYVI